MKEFKFTFTWKGETYPVDMINFVDDYPYYTVFFKVPVENSDKMEGIIARSDEGVLEQV
jgi:hypothetical protein